MVYYTTLIQYIITYYYIISFCCYTVLYRILQNINNNKAARFATTEVNNPAFPSYVSAIVKKLFNLENIFLLL